MLQWSVIYKWPLCIICIYFIQIAEQLIKLLNLDYTFSLPSSSVSISVSYAIIQGLKQELSGNALLLILFYLFYYRESY